MNLSLDLYLWQEENTFYLARCLLMQNREKIFNQLNLSGRETFAMYTYLYGKY